MKTANLISGILMLTLTSCMTENSDSHGWNIINTEISFSVQPVLTGCDRNDIYGISFEVADSCGLPALEAIELKFARESAVSSLSSVSVWRSGSGSRSAQGDLIFLSEKPAYSLNLYNKAELVSGKNSFVISFTARHDADLLGTFSLRSVKLNFSNGIRKTVRVTSEFGPVRFGKKIRSAGQDNCHTYRIPGIVTTNNGTLIAVYDARYNNSKDLQENIDIGMSRSVNGGQTWEPMRVIMDMGEYGGWPQNMNGTGDPCILYDPYNDILWVAALWMSGSAPDKAVWWTSQPGINPEQTGQFMLVKSADNGLTWSQPVNITGQIKLPEWQLLLQGPGRGITMKDGTLVFPAQFKADIGTPAIDGGKYTCHSTIVYSSDSGVTWHIGSGAKSNTTESQVVELDNGTLMLNMRDDRNRSEKGTTNGRAVSVTSDMGKTWQTHPSSNSALPEPNCMASIIAADVMIGSKLQKVLFFSNPNNRNERKNMTIKASLDMGMTWPPELQIELCQNEGYGYSCLTMTDKNTIGIIYEGIGDLYFQKIPVNDLLNIK